MQFKTILPHLVAVVIFVLAAVATFWPQFQGRELRQGDVIAYRGAAKELTDYERQTGERVLWTGTSFSGMPTYQISTIRDGNLLRRIGAPVTVFLPDQAGVFFIGMLATYLCLLLLGVSPWLSMAGALGVVLATNNLVLWKAGHETKVITIIYLPLVLAGIVATFRRRYLPGGLVFALGMALAILANHPQMLYYFGITVPIYGVYQLIRAVRERRLPHFAKATGVLVAGLLLALGCGASNLLPTREYAATTMRGGQVLETPIASSAGAAESGSGLDFDYAMGWSNGFKDALATYAPLAAGGGGRQDVDGSSDLGKAMRSAGFKVGKTVTVPLYHGALPFTEGPSYLGAVVWALFLFGLFTARRSVAIWLGAGTLLIMLMAAGKNFETFNRLLFDNLPLLNKFRTPNSALSISTLMMLTLGVLGITNWLRGAAVDAEKSRKQLLYAGVVAAVSGAFIALVLPAILDFTHPNDAATWQQYTQGQVDIAPLLAGLEATRAASYASDAWRSFLYVGLTFGTLFLLFRKTISPTVASLAIAALLVFDFSGVNGRYLSKEDWVKTPRQAAAAPFQASPADQRILQDPDPHYRVFNLTVRSFNDASTSYFHKSVGGYSAVKMRRYQDLIDGYLGQRDPDVLNMLNTKYFIVPGEGDTPAARQNPAAYGPAWLVSNVETVSSNDAEFAALGTVADLKRTAIVHDDFAASISGLDPTGEGSIELTRYSPDELTYAFNSSSEQLAVFSEIWYGPDLGWTAYIDGEPTDMFRANYLLRGLRIPAGQHEIKMVFAPGSYALGTTISFICSLLILLGLVGYLAYRWLNGRRLRNTATPIETMPGSGVR